MYCNTGNYAKAFFERLLQYSFDFIFLVLFCPLAMLLQCSIMYDLNKFITGTKHHRHFVL